MSESFEQLLEESLKTISNGEVVKGKVIAVKENEIVLNIGYKADGILTRKEFTNDSDADLSKMVQVGDELEAKILRVNDGEGQVQLSTKRLQAEKSSEMLEKALEEHTPITAKVDQVVNGGVTAVVDGIRVFIPASLVSDTYVKDLSKFADQDITFVLTEYNPRKRRVIGDCKQLLVAKRKAAQDELMSRLQVGDVIEGTVRNVTDFGAFVDIGGADGLLHISEMSWGRIENPKKLFKTGDTVRVFVKAIDGNKIALSTKFPEENPWADAENRFAIGNVVDGVVARMTDFGAFVELAKGVDALLHVSQISRDHVAKPEDVLSIGQEITAQIVDLNLDDHKISLSMKALLAPQNQPNEDADEDVADVSVEEYVQNMPEEDGEEA